MSRVSPPSGESVEATARLAMSPARRERILAKYGNKCAYPECCVSERLELDHQIALFLGGRDVEDNIIPLCIEHHLSKTRLDAKLISKVRRLRVKQLPKSEQPKSQPIRSRKFSRRWSTVEEG